MDRQTKVIGWPTGYQSSSSGGSCFNDMIKIHYFPNVGAQKKMSGSGSSQSSSALWGNPELGREVRVLEMDNDDLGL
jgi:hypothetical protein